MMSSETAVSPWSNPSYRSWFVADSILQIASQFRNLALPLLTLFVTGSLAQAGLIAAVMSLVHVVLGPLGGVLLDQMDRRLALNVYAIVSGLVWAIVSLLILCGQLSGALLWVAVIVAAVNAALLGASSNVALLSIVQGGTYAKAMASNQGRDAFLGLIAPPLGGFLYGVAHVAPFIASTVFSFIALPAVKGIKADLKPPAAERKHIIAELSDGFRYAWKNAERKTLMVMAMFMNTMAAFVLGSVSFWMMNIGVPAFKIGVTEAAAALAMLTGAYLAPKVMDKLRPGPAVVGALLWFAAAFLSTVLFPNYWGLLIGQAVAVLPLPLMNSLVLGYYFATVRLNMQGRVQSVLGIATGGLAVLPPAILGFLLPHYGYQLITSCAIALIVVGAIAFGATQTGRHLPMVKDWPKPASDGAG